MIGWRIKEFVSTHRCPNVYRSYLLRYEKVRSICTCFQRFALTSTINNLKCVVLLLLQTLAKWAQFGKVIRLENALFFSYRNRNFHRVVHETKQRGLQCILRLFFSR